MKKDKLLNLLRSFSAKELNRFLDFVSSPYFNKRQILIDFCHYLIDFHPTLSESCLVPERIPAHLLTPGKPKKKELSYLKSDLLKLAKNFLAHEQLQGSHYDTTFQTTLGLKAINSELYLSQLAELNNKLDLDDQFDNQQLILHYFVTGMLRRDGSFQPSDSEALLQKAIQKLDEFYFVNKLSFGFETLNRKQIIQYSSGLTNPLMEEIELLLRKSDAVNPRTAIYLQLFLSSKYPNEEEHLDNLVQLLWRHYQKIAPSECRSIYLATINNCMRLSRFNAGKYISLCLDLYQHGIKTKILFEDNLLSEWTYKNTIKLGLKLERFQWTEEFIREYNTYLAADVRKNALASNLAELAFSQKDYNLTFEHLNEIKTTHFKYYLSTKTLLIKTFYETQNIDSCLSALGAFTVYLSRLRDVSPAVKKNCQHFCQLLHHTLMQSSEKKKQKTKQKIQQQTPLAEREWLMEVFKKENPRFQ